MTAEEQFYLERDRRTRESGVLHSFEIPVRVVVGRDAAKSAAGQTAVLALVCMLARIHRHLQLDIPSAALLSPALVPAARLDEASRALRGPLTPSSGSIRDNHPATQSASAETFLLIYRGTLVHRANWQFLTAGQWHQVLMMGHRSELPSQHAWLRPRFCDRFLGRTSALCAFPRGIIARVTTRT